MTIFIAIKRRTLPMKVILKKITIRDLVEDYSNHLEAGVIGYHGKLDIRPPYQREFIYNDKQQQAVIDTVSKGFPLNIMYWAVNKDKDDNETYEIIDGQQRTLSICRYVEGDFAHENKYFYNLWDEEQEEILDYELDVYLCEGSEQDKLDWFETINIAGVELTQQELRNAVYHGPWTADAKKYFSKTACPAYQIGSDYMRGTPIRQDYLETTIKWISNNDIEGYMSKHQHSKDAKEIWNYYTKVMKWVKDVFKVYRREMKGLPWGPIYNEHKDLIVDEDFDADEMENKIKKLMMDEDVRNKKGIYQYVLNGKEKHLSIRAFDARQKREAYEEQDGVCVKCEEEFNFKDMEADHITPWSKGGQTTSENCQMLCRTCNRTKSDN